MNTDDAARVLPDRSSLGDFLLAARRLAWLLGAAWAVTVTSPALALTPFVAPIPRAAFVPTTEVDRPLNHRSGQIAGKGYVEDEYFLSGTASIYQHDAAGNVEIASAGNPYTTRILVRRPAESWRFSGNVVVEVYNSTAQVDKDVEFVQAGRYLLRHGDIWIGITNSPTAVNTLKTFYSASRYAPLNFGDSGLAWDAISQLGALLKHNRAAGFLRDYAVRHVYAVGESGSAQALVLYINEIHPLTRLDNGGPIYDGFIPSERFGTGTAFNSSGSPAAAPFPACDPHLVLSSEVPIIDLQTQTEITAFSEYCVRRADGDAPGDRFRLWEMAGAAHLTPFVLQNDNAARDLGGTAFVPSSALCANSLSQNDFPKQYFLQAALEALYKWVDRDVPPPHADRITLTAATPPAVALDGFGNALGGLRTPFVDFPVYTYHPNDTLVKGVGPIGALYCLIIGYKAPLDLQQLMSLYPTHDNYEDGVERETRQLRDQGFLQRENADAIIDDAETADVP